MHQECYQKIGKSETKSRRTDEQERRKLHIWIQRKDNSNTKSKELNYLQ